MDITNNIYMKPLLNEEKLKKDMEFWNIPGLSVGVIKDGEIIFENGYGLRNIASHLPMTYDTLGGIASCSKSFTSAIIATLVDEGKLGFDTPVIDYIPDFRLFDKTASDNVTVRDMLYHRTGLANHDAMWPDPSITRYEFMHRFRYLKPNKPFRSVSQYNNTVYSLIGHIAERVSGQSWEALVSNRLLEPLGMTRTCLTVADMRHDPDWATGYLERERHGCLEEMPAWEMNVGSPAAGVNSCAGDMLKWLQFHLNKGTAGGTRLISEKSMNEMHHGAVDMSNPIWDYPEVSAVKDYGMAWVNTTYRGLHLTYHCGEIEGYSSVELMVPDYNTGMFLIANKHKPVIPFLFAVVYTIIDKLIGFPEIDWFERMDAYDHPRYEGDPVYDGLEIDLMPVSGISNTHVSHPLGEYSGEYVSNAYGPVRICEAGGDLFLCYKEWRLPMEHFHYDTFRVKGLKEDTYFYTVPLTFGYDESSGHIDSLTIRIDKNVDPVRFSKI